MLEKWTNDTKKVIDMLGVLITTAELNKNSL